MGCSAMTKEMNRCLIFFLSHSLTLESGAVGEERHDVRHDVVHVLLLRVDEVRAKRVLLRPRRLRGQRVHLKQMISTRARRDHRRPSCCDMIKRPSAVIPRTV